MSKDPAFLFYPNDWLGGTMGMSAEQKGAYIDLLVFQFNNKGHFTEPEAKQVLSTCFASVWQVVKNKFKNEGENNEFFYNERLREEIEKRKSFTESRRINALHPKKTRKKSKACAKHMGNENEDENINKKKLFIIPSVDEIRKYCIERKNNIDPQLFVDKYTGNGWMVGNNKMKDWKAVVRTWEKNKFNTGGNNGNKGFNTSKQNFGADRELDRNTADEADRINAEWRKNQIAADGSKSKPT
jgi:uncharacterized protein YdaU (DUF1376 family)